MAMTAVVTIASLAIAGCRDEKRAASPRATHPAAAPQGSGGEVALNDESTTVRWLGDGNIVALTALLNSRQVAAADWELQHWGSDTTRALAEWMAQEHADIRHGIDSLTSALGITPVPPALAADLDSATRRQLAMLEVPGGRPLDRAYVNEQIASHEMMLDYLTKFSASAERAELRALIDRINGRLKGHLSRARALKTQYAQADSAKAAADSARRVRRVRQ